MVHIIISGKVQRVGFRQFIKYKAKKLDIKGWVKNLPNGNVEGMFCGDRENLNNMIKICKEGPYLARVSDLKITELTDEEFDNFTIIKD